ncbi:MAG: hypothetical protein WC533_04285 [Candidatus Pacearchaeota archaeon]
MKRLSKKAIGIDELGWWILGLVVFIIIAIIIGILWSKGGGWIDYIKCLFGSC